MTEAPTAAFARLVRRDPPRRPPVLFDTVCVLGGSIAGLLAARVLADHSRELVIVERDHLEPAVSPRPGTPQDRQVHGLLPGGLAQLERWIPGITQDIRSLGGVVLTSQEVDMYVDGVEQLQSGDTSLLQCSRPLLESALRRRVLALPNVSALSAQATGLTYRDDAVSAVRYVTEGAEREMAVDFVVDAMGRASKFSDWLEQGGYTRPPFHRMQTGVHYATAMFDRSGTDLDLRFTGARFPMLPGPGGLSVGLITPIEDDQWMIGLTVYGDSQPPRTLEEFRSLCDKLPEPFGKAASGTVTREVLTFRQADSRRRDFTGLTRFPARVVSVGDAAISLNATYAQGMSSAALHASCLSEYLGGEPDLAAPAETYFSLQKTAMDAVWAVSAGADAARTEILQGIEVPDEVQRQRWKMGQLALASATDETVAEALKAVGYMFAHPDTLTDPALIERAVAVNRRVTAGG
ncbi:FAD-dependent oxidoreductase [Streptomyces sp. NPDC086783]|uniref:FAD-dependent oxidoreductase n=1 Tax=Streptomyces sp. NPDC086783 TaxID=3365758 RepID=UPI00382A498E